jgi:hypothetical protein
MFLGELNMKKIKVTYFQDSGHGWIAVKRSLLKEIGALEHISSCSYQKGDTVYLEEDCDASKFFKLYFASKGMDYISSLQLDDYFDMKSIHSERSAIRNYARFTINKVSAKDLKDGMKVRLYSKEYIVKFNSAINKFVLMNEIGQHFRITSNNIDSMVDITTPLENALTE